LEECRRGPIVVLYQHLPGGTEENYNNLKSKQLVTQSNKSKMSLRTNNNGPLENNINLSHRTNSYLLRLLTL